MTDRPDRFHNLSQKPARLAADLLLHYSFELAGYAVVQQIEIWLEFYPAEWLPIALIEALYQGRYKAISVEQILNLWQRREHPVYHFNHEFERLICANLPHSGSSEIEEVPEPVPKPKRPSASLSYRKMVLELPSIRAASQLDRLSEIPPFKLSSRRMVPATVDQFSGPSEAQLFPVEVPMKVALEAPGANGAATLEPPVVAGDGDREFKDFKEGVVFGLSSGLAVPTLKPRFKLELSHYYQPHWLAFLEPLPTIAPPAMARSGIAPPAMESSINVPLTPETTASESQSPQNVL